MYFLNLKQELILVGMLLSLKRSCIRFYGMCTFSTMNQMQNTDYVLPLLRGHKDKYYGLFQF